MEKKLKCRIKGNVYDCRGGGIGGAKITCNGKQTTTLFDGSYIFDIEPSSYTVTVSLKGFRSESKTVTLIESEEKAVNFILQEASGNARIVGQVYDASTMKPISHKGTVILTMPVSNRSVTIGKNGYFEFAKLPSDTYDVWTSIQGYIDEKITVTVAEGETKKIEVYCRAGPSEEPPWG